MGNFTGAELSRAGISRGLTGLARFPIRRVSSIDKDLRYFNELEQVLVDKIEAFLQDLFAGPTCVLELK